MGKRATTEQRTLQKLAGMPKKYYNSKVKERNRRVLKVIWKKISILKRSKRISVNI